jgi:hypothetical protein
MMQPQKSIFEKKLLSGRLWSVRTSVFNKKNSLFGLKISLLRSKNSLFRRVGNSVANG